MAALHVALDALGAEHTVIEREIFPGLEADDLILSDFQLDAALLATETTMSLYQFFCGVDRFIFPSTGRKVVEMRPELLLERLFGDGGLSHWLPLSAAIAQARLICVYTPDRVLANCRRGQASNS